MREAAKLDKRSQEICKMLEKWDDGVVGYKMCGGLVYYRDYVYVLGVRGLQKEILTHFHNNKEGGHSIWLRTYVRVKHFFY